MKLNQIENILNPLILERAELYRENGHVISLSETKPLVFDAEVEGSELYNVEVKLSSRGEVIYALCECPYDKGPICKHTAAVLLEIKDEFQQKDKAPSASKRNFADQLSKLSKDELVALLVDFSNHLEEVERALSLKFISVDNKEGLKQYKKLIRSSIKQHSDRHGFVSYRNAPYAVTGAEEVLAKAEEALESGYHLRAVEISFCILHELVELLQSCDDSDGHVGGLIGFCLNVIHSTASQFEDSTFKDRSALFKLLLKEVLHPSLEGWNEWQLSLMESAVYLIKSAEEKGLWSNLINRLESHERKESSYSSYFSEEAARLRYQVIHKLEGDAQALKFLEANLDMTIFRKMAIEEAIKNLQFDKALELAEQGEVKDTIRSYPGLVDQWKKYRYEIYELTHQVEHQIKLAEEFAISGDYHFYLSLKKLHKKDAWEAAYKGFLDKLEANCGVNWNAASLYTRVLIEEKETLRLLNYVNKHNRTLVDYYPHLVAEYAEEVFLLFTKVISEEAARSSNRNEYRKVCGIIRHLIKAGGKDQAKKLIEQLCLTYPKRTALLDELQKVILI